MNPLGFRMQTKSRETAHSFAVARDPMTNYDLVESRNGDRGFAYH